MTLNEHWSRLEQMYLSAAINKQVYRDVTISIERGQSRISHRAEAAFFHAAQSIHGSVYFKMLDDAAYFAASSLVQDEFLYTVNFQIQLLRPVTEGVLRAEGWVEKAGKTVILAQSNLYNEQHKRVGIGHGQFMKSGLPLEKMKGYKI